MMIKHLVGLIFIFAIGCSREKQPVYCVMFETDRCIIASESSNSDIRELDSTSGFEITEGSHWILHYEGRYICGRTPEQVGADPKSCMIIVK